MHVTGATLWVGGLVALAVASLRRVHDPDAANPLAAQSDFIGRTVILPAMIATMLPGIALGHLSGGMQPWAGWGLAVFLAYLGLTIGFIRRYKRELARLDEPTASSAARGTILRRRVTRLGVLNILLLLTAVWAMVYKPSF